MIILITLHKHLSEGHILRNGVLKLIPLQRVLSPLQILLQLRQTPLILNKEINPGRIVLLLHLKLLARLDVLRNASMRNIVKIGECLNIAGR